MVIMASVILKDLLVDRYAYPNNPYEIAFGFGLERVSRWLHRKVATGTTQVMRLSPASRSELR